MERTSCRKKRNFWEQKIKVLVGEVDANKDGLVGGIKAGPQGATKTQFGGRSAEPVPHGPTDTGSGFRLL